MPLAILKQQEARGYRIIIILSYQRIELRVAFQNMLSSLSLKTKAIYMRKFFIDNTVVIILYALIRPGKFTG